MVVNESENVLPAVTIERAMNFLSTTGFSTAIGFTTGATASTMTTASGAGLALGASGSSFAAATPVVTVTARRMRRMLFMMTPCVIGFAFRPSICLLRSVMNGDYVGTCTSHNRK